MKMSSLLSKKPKNIFFLPDLGLYDIHQQSRNFLKNKTKMEMKNGTFMKIEKNQRMYPDLLGSKYWKEKLGVIFVLIKGPSRVLITEKVL